MLDHLNARSAVHRGMGCRQIFPSVVKPPASVRVPWPLARVSRQSANDKSDEMIPGAVYRPPDIYFTVEKNPGIPQLRDCLMKAVHITSNGVP